MTLSVIPSSRYACQQPCPVPSCSSGLPARHRLRDTRRRAHEEAKVCADCWHDAAAWTGIQQIGEGPGEYARALRSVPPAAGPTTRTKGEGYERKEKKRTCPPEYREAVTRVLQPFVRPMTTSSIADLAGIDRRRAYSALRALEAEGAMVKHDARGESNVVRWSLRVAVIACVHCGEPRKLGHRCVKWRT